MIGILALTSLFIKRLYEHPKRKLHVFFLDVSKQVISGLIIHTINIAISIVITQQHQQIGDQCAAYLTSSFLDVTLGILLMTLIFKIQKEYFTITENLIYEQGNYINYNGTIDFEAYILQTILWICMQMLSKLCIFIFLSNFYEISFVGIAILKYFDFEMVNKLVFVLLVVPIMSNMLCFLVYDGMLKKKFRESSD